MNFTPAITAKPFIKCTALVPFMMSNRLYNRYQTITISTIFRMLLHAPKLLQLNCITQPPFLYPL